MEKTVYLIWFAEELSKFSQNRMPQNTTWHVEYTIYMVLFHVRHAILSW